jgi:hypothetical protein
MLIFVNKKGEAQGSQFTLVVDSAREYRPW